MEAEEWNIAVIVAHEPLPLWGWEMSGGMGVI